MGADQSYAAAIDDTTGEFNITIAELFDSGTLYVSFCFENGVNTGVAKRHCNAARRRRSLIVERRARVGSICRSSWRNRLQLMDKTFAISKRSHAGDFAKSFCKMALIEESNCRADLGNALCRAGEQVLCVLNAAR